MPMFWSKKSKAEKNYEQSARPAKGGAGTRNARAMKGGKSAGAEAAAKPAKAAKALVPALAAGSVSSAADVIIRPHVTEKSGLLSQSGVYTFQVSANATKSSVMKAMSALYKVSPIRVAMINNPSKRVFVRGKRGVVAGVRKAMVTVKKGDKIDFV